MAETPTDIKTVQTTKKEEKPPVKDLSRMNRKHRLRILRQIAQGKKPKEQYYSSADYQ